MYTLSTYASLCFIFCYVFRLCDISKFSLGSPSTTSVDCSMLFICGKPQVNGGSVSIKTDAIWVDQVKKLTLKSSLFYYIYKKNPQNSRKTQALGLKAYLSRPRRLCKSQKAYVRTQKSKRTTYMLKEIRKGPLILYSRKFCLFFTSPYKSSEDGLLRLFLLKWSASSSLCSLSLLAEKKYLGRRLLYTQFIDCISRVWPWPTAHFPRVRAEATVA